MKIKSSLRTEFTPLGDRKVTQIRFFKCSNSFFDICSNVMIKLRITRCWSKFFFPSTDAEWGLRSLNEGYVRWRKKMVLGGCENRQSTVYKSLYYRYFQTRYEPHWYYGIPNKRESYLKCFKFRGDWNFANLANLDKIRQIKSPLKFLVKLRYVYKRRKSVFVLKKSTFLQKSHFGHSSNLIHFSYYG